MGREKALQEKRKEEAKLRKRLNELKDMQQAVHEEREMKEKNAEAKQAYTNKRNALFNKWREGNGAVHLGAKFNVNEQGKWIDLYDMILPFVPPNVREELSDA